MPIQETQDKDEEVHVVLLNFGGDVDDGSSNGILDTACASTLCGDQWFRKYLEIEKLRTVQSTVSSRNFIFGGGENARSLKCVLLPIDIYGRRCYVKTDIIPGKLSVHFSKSTLKKIAAIINTTQDTISIFQSKQNHPSQLSTLRC